MINVTLLLTTMMAAGAGQAQPAVVTEAAIAQTDARFAHWLGCWRLEDDLVGTGARLCITPEEPGGVKLQSFLKARLGRDEIIVPDGATHTITDPDCRGTERAQWSSDGLRVFRDIDVTCGSDAPRKVSNISFLLNGSSWINVQHVEGEGARNVRVQRYRRASDQTLADGTRAPVPSARMVANAPRATAQDWDVDDVIEATGKMPADAVQAAISEGRGAFDLNKKALIAMADANVPEPVVDLLVALTFPKQFVVNRAGGSGGYTPMGISTGNYWYDPLLSPLDYSVYADCYGSGYRSYYATCGSAFGPYGAFGNNYGYGGYANAVPGGWVVVGLNPTQPGAAQPEGRVVNGRGYTQVRPRSPEPTQTRTGSVGNGDATNGGSSGASTQGYTSGSSGSSSGSDSGGRTAVPRPPGGR